MRDDLNGPDGAPGGWPGGPGPTSTASDAHDTTTTANVGEMNAIQRLLAGTNWTREDVDLALSAVSTLILLYWAYSEVQ